MYAPVPTPIHRRDQHRDRDVDEYADEHGNANRDQHGNANRDQHRDRQPHQHRNANRDRHADQHRDPDPPTGDRDSQRRVHQKSVLHATEKGDIVSMPIGGNASDIVNAANSNVTGIADDARTAFSTGWKAPTDVSCVGRRQAQHKPRSSPDWMHPMVWSMTRRPTRCTGRTATHGLSRMRSPLIRSPHCRSRSDGTAALAVDSERQRIYWTAGVTVKWANLSAPTTSYTLLTSMGGANSLYVDGPNDYIYWSGSYSREIKRASLIGTDQGIVTIVTTSATPSPGRRHALRDYG